MGPKKPRRKVQRRTIELKKDIIAKHESGVRVTDLSIQYGMPKSTISTILKSKESYKACNVAKGVSIISKKRPQVIEEMEKLLLIYINENQLQNEAESIICEKALEIYSDLTRNTPSTANDENTFKASRGWFRKFERRTGLHTPVKVKYKQCNN